MTWHPSGPVWPRQAPSAPRLATPPGHPSGIPSGHTVWPPVRPRWAPRLGTPSGPVWPRRAPRLATPSAHPVCPPRRAPRPAPIGHPVRPYQVPRLATPSGPVGHSVWPRRAPRLATPLGAPSGTPALSRGSGRPSISEPLDPCPFRPPTVALLFTYIKPSNPPLHHFLHSPICIGTCDCVATAALRGSWSLGAGSNCLGQALPVSFPQFT
jgi:hypothetical protein